MPVSYTHLISLAALISNANLVLIINYMFINIHGDFDYYALSIVGTIENVQYFAFIFKLIKKFLSFISFSTSSLFNLVEIPKIFSLGSVSYTHLDVYKRQV